MNADRRDRLINDALAAGRIGDAEVPAWRARFASNSNHAAKLLYALPPLEAASAPADDGQVTDEEMSALFSSRVPATTRPALGAAEQAEDMATLFPGRIAS